MAGWIKLFRKFQEWEWYSDPNTKAVFIHCLLRANQTAGEWRGVHYDAGEFITSLPSLCKELGLTMRQARTALERLQATGELTSRTTDKTTGKRIPKGRIITVNNWVQYQANDTQNDTQNDRQTTRKTAGKRQASDNSIRREEDKEDKNIYIVENENTITDLFHAICHSLPKVRSISDTRRKHIKALLKTYTVDDFKTVFTKAESSDFLSGRSGKWSGCCFDWLIKQSNFLKVLEGNYDNKQAAAKFNNAPSREMDMSAVEKMLRATN